MAGTSGACPADRNPVWKLAESKVMSQARFRGAPSSLVCCQRVTFPRGGRRPPPALPRHLSPGRSAWGRGDAPEAVGVQEGRETRILVGQSANDPSLLSCPWGPALLKHPGGALAPSVPCTRLWVKEGRTRRLPFLSGRLIHGVQVLGPP